MNGVCEGVRLKDDKFVVGRNGLPEVLVQVTVNANGLCCPGRRDGFPLREFDDGGPTCASAKSQEQDTKNEITGPQAPGIAHAAGA